MNPLVRDIRDAIPPWRVSVIRIAQIQHGTVRIGNGVLVVPSSTQAVLGILVSRTDMEGHVGKPAIRDAEV